MQKTLLLIGLFIQSQLLLSQKDVLQHVEPPNWWTNMEHHAVEVMLHGKNIANYTVSVDGLTLIGVSKTENPNYIFATIETAGAKAGTYTISLKQGSKVKLSIPYELKTRNENSKNRIGFTSEDMVYLLMPDRFANGDEKNDSHPSVVEKLNRDKPGGRHGGDIQGIIDHLDYIADLGATAIWSTPLLEDNDTNYSYHTYGQSDVYKVDPRYGTNDDYKRLVEKAHAKNIKVIMDVVPNHWGANHWMLFDLPTYTWIHQFPGFKQTSFRASTQMDPNRSDLDLKINADGWFVRSMPDLNQNNPLVLNYLIQNNIWWMEFSGVDGLRVDTYIYNDKAGIAEWTRKIMEEYPKSNIVGEVWMHDQAHQSFWQKDSPVSAIQHYNTHLPSVMDFTLNDGIIEALKEEKQGWDKGVMRFYENFVNDFLYANPNNLLIFAENHDTQRLNTIYTSLADYQLAMTLLGTVRGIPQVYYGSEIGMAGDKNKGDADIRQDFPGGWKNDTNNAFTKEGRTKDQEAYHSFTKKVFNYRKKSAALKTGKTLQFVPENNVYVYFRYTDNETIMVVINNSKEQQAVSLDRFQEILGNVKNGSDILSNKTIDFSKKNLEIAGKSSLIIELQK